MLEQRDVSWEDLRLILDAHIPSLSLEELPAASQRGQAHKQGSDCIIVTCEAF
jgi:hypothetical protein